MILTVDIGNTNTVIGGFKNDKLQFVSKISTDIRNTDAEFAARIKGVLTLNETDGGKISGAVISSVVPMLTAAVKKAVRFVCGVEALVVGPGMKTGLNLLVDNPAQVGADMISACVAARVLCTDAMAVIDMGTATKIMLVDGKGAFLGVSIVPGVELSLNALASGASQLPYVSLEMPKHIICKNTVDCMKSGVIYGNISMLDGMLERIEEEFGAPLKAFATGGMAETIVPYCKHEIKICPNLVIEGLNVIYNKNTK